MTDSPKWSAFMKRSVKRILPILLTLVVAADMQRILCGILLVVV